MSINEIAWMGTEISANDEWIELYNNSENDIDLTSWLIVAEDGSPVIELNGIVEGQEYFLLERTDDESVPGIKADLLYVGVLGNSGEYLELVNAQGESVQTIDCGEGWLGGSNENKLTMSMLADGLWGNSSVSGGTPGSENIIDTFDEGESSEDDGSENTASGTPYDEIDNENEITDNIQAIIKKGDVLINEFVCDPSDGDVEWLELFNKSNVEIDLDGWSIEDGGNARTVLSGTIGSSGQNRFYIIEKPRGNLNNNGDQISLIDEGGNIIDVVAYGDWDDGLINDNAPLAKDPYSTARTSDGKNSGVCAKDFAVTLTPTRANYNSITVEISESPKTKQQKKYSNDILVSEIFPNPIGADDEAEFIELFNSSEIRINICGWEIGDSTGKRFQISVDTVESCYLEPAEYSAFFRNITKIVLNNDTDSVHIYAPGYEKAVESLGYEKAPEGMSYSLYRAKDTDDFEYVWTDETTPNIKNKINKIEKIKIIDFSVPLQLIVGVPVFFDSSDHETDDVINNYQWDFGDGFTNILANPEHTYFKPGEYMVSLCIGGESGTSSIEKKINVQEKKGLAGNYKSGTSTLSADLIISEVLPDPIGLDGEGEFVEIFNKGNTRVNLINWSIDDDYGGSHEYIFSDDIWLDAGGYYVLPRETSKLAFNNNFDAVRLFDSEKRLIDEVEYEDPGEGFAYARGENSKWFWTSESTPNKENKIKVSSIVLYEETKESQSMDISVSGGQVDVFFGDVEEMSLGSQIVATGTVLVEPGILGAQIFYIQGSYGMQIYSYKKDFPELKEGDKVLVSGELSAVGGEYRIKTKTKNDIKLLGINTALEPELIQCDRLEDDMVGKLIEISGEIVERKGASVYLDDGTDEAKVYIRSTTNIEATSFEEGAEITVIGILSKTKTGLRLLPRSNKDITEISIKYENKGAVLGEVAVNDEWDLEKRNKKEELMKYIIISLLAIISGGVWYVLKKIV